MTSIVGAARELATLADEVAEIDWRHPVWLALVGGTAVLEAAARAAGSRTSVGELYATFLGANGGPRSDTFIACERAHPGEDEDPAEVIAGAVAAARAAAALIARLDGELPDQPLLRALGWRDGWLARVPLPAGTARVVLVAPDGAFLAGLEHADAQIAEALGAACAGRPASILTRVDPGDRAPAPAAVAVALAPEALATARHLHRRAWTAGGGPWLGLGRTDALDLVTTCHLAVDGYGHGRIAAALLGEQPAPDPSVVAAARRGLGERGPFRPAPALPIAQPVGIATRVVAGEVSFSRAAYAFGRTLERAFPGRPGARFSPTFQVPLVPGDRSDADRRRRRPLIGLFALRSGESYGSFRERLHAALPRETQAAGLLTRILQAAASAPLPPAWRRRLLVSRTAAHPLLPAVEVLAGRGQISLIRLDVDAPRLFAASAPALADAVGGCVLTLLPGRWSYTATLCGSGRAGSADGARALLDLFAAELGGDR